MTINIVQAIFLGLFACLASLPGMGGTTIGNYTLGRPLVGGLIVGIIMGNVGLGIIVGAAIQVVYIALVTPGGTVSADVRAVTYIGIPLAMMGITAQGLDPNSAAAAGYAASIGSAVGTLGTVLFYGTQTMNLVWQGIGWGSIIYLSALTSIDQEQYESARLDGAGRLQQIIYITIPNILPTIMIMLILRIGK